MSETESTGGTSSRKLSIRTKLFYGAGASAESAIAIAFNSFNFLFYNNVLGLPGTLAGLAVTIAVVFDAISDPMIGSISDRWRSKLGRRHPFLFVAPIPLGLCFFAIYSPPQFLEQIGLFIWFTFFTISLRIALTFYHVPHLALGAELSDDYRERSVIMGYNSILGMVGGASAFFLSWTWLGAVEGGTSKAENFMPIGLAIGVFATLVVWMSAYFTRDQIPYLKKISDDLPAFSIKQLVSDILLCFNNRNYLWLLLGLLCLAATSGVRETMSAYVNLFYWGLEPNQLRFFGLVTPLAFIIAFIATPRLHARFDKQKTMIGSVLVYVLASTLPIVLRILGLFPGNDHPFTFPLLAAFVAIYYGAVAILGITVLSALADVADDHELLTGRRQEGIFYSARTFISKMTGGLGLLIGGIAIDIINWPTGVTSGDIVDPDILFSLAIVDGPIAAIPSLFAVFFYGRYKINKTRYLEIHAELAARRALALEEKPTL
jgi:GPH family glycoside/pentoside/hexuronide:cation symporter